jgi:CRISPR-associated protein Csb2
VSLHLEIHFLTGHYVATSFNDRGSGEWPPHPARIFSALTAALYDGEPADQPCEAAALRWLEALPPPTLHATDASLRSVHTVYVPVNDESALPGTLDRWLIELEEAEQALAAVDETDAKARKKAEKAVEKAHAKVLATSEQTLTADLRCPPETAASLLPGARGRQGRTFPVRVPQEPRVVLSWDHTPEPEVYAALDAVSARVARLGHSSSVVAVRVLTEAPETEGLRALAPSPDGAHTLRVPEPGQLDRLDALHAQHQQTTQRTMPAAFQRYGDPAPQRPPAPKASALADGTWVRWRVVAPEGGSRLLLNLTMAERLGRTLKSTLLHFAGEQAPSALTGHASDGPPLRVPHAAMLPLADVGGRWATGSVLGMALVLPTDLSPADLRAVAQALRDAEQGGLKLLLGRAGVLNLERLSDDDTRVSLAQDTWCAPSKRWATVTPVALDRNPGDLLSRDPDVVQAAVERAEASIAQSCLDIGLPAPAAVLAQKRSAFSGAPPARRFMPFPYQTSHGFRRVCVHAELVFPEPVRGPVLLGAGRYVGVGLCRPLKETR